MASTDHDVGIRVLQDLRSTATAAAPTTDTNGPGHCADAGVHLPRPARMLDILTEPAPQRLSFSISRANKESGQLIPEITSNLGSHLSRRESCNSRLTAHCHCSSVTQHGQDCVSCGPDDRANNIGWNKHQQGDQRKAQESQRKQTIGTEPRLILFEHRACGCSPVRRVLGIEKAQQLASYLANWASSPSSSTHRARVRQLLQRSRCNIYAVDLRLGNWQFGEVRRIICCSIQGDSLCAICLESRASL